MDRECIYKKLGAYEEKDCCARCEGFGLFLNEDGYYWRCRLYMTKDDLKQEVKENTELYKLLSEISSPGFDGWKYNEL